jgi:TetR/AcrR family acrAB operon transcriptional repressor
MLLSTVGSILWAGKRIMARRTKEQAFETRNEIMDAAISVFVDYGFAKASLNEIADRAGVTRGAVYWHFKNKADIFKALDDQLHNSLLEIILSDLEKNHREPLKQLENLCTALLVDLGRDQKKKDVMTIFLLKCDYTGDTAHFQERHNEKKASNLALFSRYFRKAQDKGHLSKNADPDILTTGLSCYLCGITHEYIRTPALIDMEKQAALLMRQFFRGIQ